VERARCCFGAAAFITVRRSESSPLNLLPGRPQNPGGKR
jgi:hypothetical protein